MLSTCIIYIKVKLRRIIRVVITEEGLFFISAHLFSPSSSPCTYPFILITTIKPSWLRHPFLGDLLAHSFFFLEFLYCIFIALLSPRLLHFIGLRHLWLLSYFPHSVLDYSDKMPSFFFFFLCVYPPFALTSCAFIYDLACFVQLHFFFRKEEDGRAGICIFLGK